MPTVWFYQLIGEIPITRMSILLVVIILILSFRSSVDAGVDEAMQAIKQGDYRAGIHELYKAAKNGNTRAQLRLAGLYTLGLGVKKIIKPQCIGSTKQPLKTFLTNTFRQHSHF